MKIVVAGKGGSGKTTVSGTVARGLARAGHSVLALDADTNPMLGISLGVGAEETYRLLAVRQATDAAPEHDHTVEGMIDAFGIDAPDGVRLVVALREAVVDPGCICQGIMPQQLFAQIEDADRIVVCDMEAGVGPIVRGGKGDTVVVVAEPSVKSIDVARRAAGAASAEGAEVIVVANRVRDGADVEAIASELAGYEVVAVPEDAVIAKADEDGAAPIDADPASPGVRALLGLAQRLARQPAAA